MKIVPLYQSGDLLLCTIGYYSPEFFISRLHAPHLPLYARCVEARCSGTSVANDPPLPNSVRTTKNLPSFS